MIILIAAVLGVFLGASHARRRGGNRLDMAQYAAAYAIGLMILALFLSLFLGRLID